MKRRSIPRAYETLKTYRLQGIAFHRSGPETSRASSGAREWGADFKRGINRNCMNCGGFHYVKCVILIQRLNHPPVASAHQRPRTGELR